jgi:hypothetical protein
MKRIKKKKKPEERFEKFSVYPFCKKR